MSTPNMGLDLPIPGVTTGPAWAEQIDAAFTAVDAHDHSAGSGAAIHIADVLGAGTMARQDASAVSITGGTIAVSGDPASALQVATKQYVDAIGSAGVANSIAALATVPSPTAGRVFFTLGYSSAGDGGGAMWRFDPSSSAAPDAMFYVAHSIATGRFVRVLTSNEVSVCSGGIFSNTVTPQGSALASVHQKCTAFGGIAILRIPSNFTIVISDNCTLSPDGPWLLGSDHTTRLVGNPDGVSAAGLGITSTFIGNHQEDPYGPNYWTESLIGGAGNRNTGALASVAGLSVGQKVVVRYGADPTDQGLAYWYHFDTIIAINTGTNVVTLKEGCPDNVPNVVGINIQRLPNKHDIIILDKFCDSWHGGNFSTRNVHFAASFCRNVDIGNVHVEYGTECFSVTFDTGSYLHDIDCEWVTTEGGTIISWLIQGWSHTRLTVERMSCVSNNANVYSQEGQNRGTAIRDAYITAAATPIGTNVEVSLSAPTGIVNWYNVVVDGIGTCGFDQYCNVTNLEIRGQLNQGGSGFYGSCLDVAINADQVLGSLFFRGVKWSRVVKADRMIMPLSPSVTMDIPFPVAGVPRRVALRFSTLTGVTSITQKTSIAPGPTLDLLAGLTAGTFQQNYSSTALGNNYPGGYGDGTPTPNSHLIRIVTGVTVPAGAYVEVDTEYWEADDSAWIAAQPLGTKVGIVAPTASADYVGQWFLDSVALKFYRSIQVGQGASDWVAT